MTSTLKKEPIMTMQNPWALLLMPDVYRQTGQGRSTFYNNVKEGLVTTPVRVGPRRVAVPQSEITALNAARVAGKSDDEIRALVVQLHEARKSAV
jgi:prophage regulatory protein